MASGVIKALAVSRPLPFDPCLHVVHLNQLAAHQGVHALPQGL